MPRLAAEVRRRRRRATAKGGTLPAGLRSRSLRYVAGAGAAAVAWLGSLAVAGAAEPAADELTADVACETRSGPGKLRCSVRVRATGAGARLQWCDAIVVEAPVTAPPLRTRLARGDAIRVGTDEQELTLALGALGDGAGTLRVRVRAVVCVADGCHPATREASTRVVVGAVPDAGGD